MPAASGLYTTQLTSLIAKPFATKGPEADNSHVFSHHHLVCGFLFFFYTSVQQHNGTTPNVPRKEGALSDLWAARDGRASNVPRKEGALSDLWAARDGRASNVPRREGALSDL